MSDDSPGFSFYSNKSKQNKTLESCLQQSPKCASDSSTSGENEQNTCLVNSLSRSNSSKHQSLSEKTGYDQASTAMSPSFRSLQSHTESSETISKQPVSSIPSSYPQIFCNPVSDYENPESKSTRNHQDSPVEEETSTNSDCSISSDEMLVDVERSEVRNTQLEPDQRCGVCKKLLSQKSPWCSHKILRCGDMPATSVFPCHHVYHVECLDKVIPTAQTRDPSCHVCSNTIPAMEQQELIVPETLELALRSLRRSRTNVGSETISSLCNDNGRRQVRRRSQKWTKLSCCLNISFLSSPRNPT